MTWTTANTTRTTTKSDREPTPFDDFYLNLGVTVPMAVYSAEGEPMVGDDGQPMTEDKYVRLSLGVSVAALTDPKVFANSNPGYAEQAAIQSAIQEALRDKCLNGGLKPGEMEPVQLDAVLYRRVIAEDAANKAPTAQATAIAAKIFG